VLARTGMAGFDLPYTDGRITATLRVGFGIGLRVATAVDIARRRPLISGALIIHDFERRCSFDPDSGADIEDSSRPDKTASVV